MEQEAFVVVMVSPKDWGRKLSPIHPPLRSDDGKKRQAMHVSTEGAERGRGDEGIVGRMK